MKPNVLKERQEELYSCWCNESNDPVTQEWREDLTPDENALVDYWDRVSADGMLRLIKSILKNRED